MVSQAEIEAAEKVKDATHHLVVVLAECGFQAPRNGRLTIRLRNGAFNGCSAETPIITEMQCTAMRIEAKGAR